MWLWCANVSVVVTRLQKIWRKSGACSSCRCVRSALVVENGISMLLLQLSILLSAEVNQTLHDVWPSPQLVLYMYILGALTPWQNFAVCKIHFAFNFKSCVLLYWQHYCTALEQWSSAKLCGIGQGMLLRMARCFFHMYIQRGSHYMVLPCHIF